MSDHTKRMEEAEALAVDLGLDPPTYTDVVIIAAALLAAEARGLRRVAERMRNRASLHETINCLELARDCDYEAARLENPHD